MGTQAPISPSLICLSALAVLQPFAFGQSPESAEVTSHETEPAFKLQVQRNLVLVRVVVRDSKGRAVGDLHKEDFRLLDDGKPQDIAHFAVETPSKAPGAAAPAPKQAETEASAEISATPVTPLRYVALFFDDVHESREEVMRTSAAADGYLEATLLPGDRAGIFTSSGQATLDFTDDRSKLHETLSLLVPRPIATPNTCPDIFPYQAHLIVYQHDSSATDATVEELIQCRYRGDRTYASAAQGEVLGEAIRALNSDEAQSEYSLRGLDQLVRRMGVLPGQRNIIVVSPGFFTENRKYQLGEIIDRALRSSVVVSALDSKGLDAPVSLGDASKQVVATPGRVDLMARKEATKIAGYQRDLDVLGQLAQDTGGMFFHNSNDLAEGFRRVGTLAEVYYILGFSPHSLKPDGRFHSVKINLPGRNGLELEARRGYFAPRQSPDTSAQDKEDLELAVFSQDESNGLPIDVHTQFFRLGESDAKLSILTHVDLKTLRFRREEGRNLKKLTFVTALFDRDGKYLTGKERVLEFRLRDVSLERLLPSGVNIKTSFDLKPGSYLVREVARDAEDGQMTALSRAVEIPFVR
jgi:VWFA-related protein